MWILISTITAISFAGGGLLSKHIITKVMHEYKLLFWRALLSIPILATVFFFIEFKLPNPAFYKYLLMSVSLNTITFILFLKAIKYGEVSTTYIIVAATPLFNIIASYFILSEIVSILSFVGMFTVFIGIYFLFIENKSDNIFSPVKRILSNKASFYALCVTLLWSVTGTFDKLAVQNSNPYIYGIAFNILTSIIFFGFILYNKNTIDKTNVNTKNLILFIIYIISVNVLLISQFTAIMMTNVSYVLMIKRSGVVLTVIFGRIFYNEINLRKKFISLFIILLGDYIIYLGA